MSKSKNITRTDERNLREFVELGGVPDAAGLADIVKAERIESALAYATAYREKYNARIDEENATMKKSTTKKSTTKKSKKAAAKKPATAKKPAAAKKPATAKKAATTKKAAAAPKKAAAAPKKERKPRTDVTALEGYADLPTSKACPRCESTRQLKSFYIFNRGGKAVVSAYCRDCYRAANKEWRDSKAAS